jgi:hypothetical protein
MFYDDDDFKAFSVELEVDLIFEEIKKIRQLYLSDEIKWDVALNRIQNISTEGHANILKQINEREKENEINT